MGAEFGHDECEPRWQQYPYELRSHNLNSQKQEIGLVLCWVCSATFEFGITKAEWNEMVREGTARKEPQYTPADAA